MIPVTGPLEVNHIELAGIRARTLGKDVHFEQVSPDEFVKTIGLNGDPSFAAHFWSGLPE